MPFSRIPLASIRYLKISRSFIFEVRCQSKNNAKIMRLEILALYGTLYLVTQYFFYCMNRPLFCAIRVIRGGHKPHFLALLKKNMIASGSVPAIIIIQFAECALFIIITRTKKHLKMNKEVGMLLPKKELIHASGVRKSNNYYEDIYISPSIHTHRFHPLAIF